MKAVAVQSVSPHSPAKKQEAKSLSAHSSPVSVQPTSLIDGPFIQRKAGCACGGDCPRCESRSKPAHQTKLKVSTPGDHYEQEADRVAEQVMRMPDSARGTGIGMAQSSPLQLQRKCASCESEQKGKEEEETLQRKEQTGHTLPAPLTAGAQAQVAELRGGGQPLPASERAFFEPRFGRDFSRVRIHTDARAAESARSVNALAYTIGPDIVFGAGQFAPEASGGRRLLAHELQHVLQQGAAETVRRQEGEGKEDAAGEPKDATDIDAPEFGEEAKEPGCPTGNVQLGKIEPDPPCAEDKSLESDDTWEHFEFCRGSDVFRDSTAPGRIRTLARNQPSLARFNLHTYASIEGDDRENANLSCHRARRVARELLNAGVLPENIEIKGKGETTKFNITRFDDLREDNLRANRRVVLNADTKDIPERPKLPEPEPEPEEETGAEKAARVIRRRHQMLETAKSTLSGGHYRLAADAYISHWTCGEYPTLRSAVDQTEVRLQGDPEAAGLGAGPRGTETIKEPFNLTILPPETFTTIDPMSCLMARIIDLSFHLKAEPHIAEPFKGLDAREMRHRGGLFLVELAGVLPCADRDPSDATKSTTWFGSSDRPNRDPLAQYPQPPCAEKPLEGAWVSEKEKKTKEEHDLGAGKKPLTFTPSKPLSTSTTVEPTAFRFDLQKNNAFLGKSGEAARPRVLARSSVQAQGDPTLFPRYQLGFVRTIQDDETVIEYVDGFHLRRQLPSSMRDGSPATPAPWLDNPVTPKEVTELESDAPPNPPELEFPFALLTHALFTMKRDKDDKLLAQDQPGRLPIDPLAENIVNRVRRRIEYTLWTAARRENAPLDRFNTNFLEAERVVVLQEADIKLDSSAKVSASGDTVVNGEDAGIGLERFARLSGPLPSSFGADGSGFALSDKRILTRDMPEARDEAEEGLDTQAYRTRVIALTTPLREALGLTQALDMLIFVDVKSGRMMVPGIGHRTGDPKSDFIFPVAGSGIGEAGPTMSLPVHVVPSVQGDKPGAFAQRNLLDNLAERFYMQGRKDLILRQTKLIDEKKRGGSSTIEVSLPPLSGTPAVQRHLHEVPGALTIFREVWSEFTKDCRIERSATIIIDRRTGKLRRILHIGKEPKVVNGQIIHSVTFCVEPSEGGDNHLNVNESVLGAVHAHPKGIRPSLQDQEQVREIEGLGTPSAQQKMQRICGNELYVLLRDSSNDLDVILLGSDEGRHRELGPILGKVEGCKL